MIQRIFVGVEAASTSFVIEGSMRATYRFTESYEIRASIP